MAERTHLADGANRKLRERAEQPGSEQDTQSGKSNELGRKGERLFLDTRDRLKKAGNQTDDERKAEKGRNDVEREDNQFFKQIDGHFRGHGREGGLEESGVRSQEKNPSPEPYAVSVCNS